jgi:hypothetical protein
VKFQLASRHSGEGPLLSGVNEALQKSATRSLMSTIFSENSTLPIRHPSESWDPVSLTLCKSLDPSFRWDDEHLAIPATRVEIFPGQRWAKAGIRFKYASEGHDIHLYRVLRTTCLYWIPAFAGMTVTQG